MTRKTGPPRELPQILANWVVPASDETDRHDGTVALSRKIFLEGWFLPQLAELNKQSTYVVTDAWWKTIKGGFATEYFLNGHLGRDDATTDELLFRPVAKDEVDQSVLSGLEPDTPGHWYQYKFDNQKDDTLIRFYVHVDIPSSTGWVEGKWNASIILDGTNDGELVIKVGDIVPQITQNIDEAWLRIKFESFLKVIKGSNQILTIIAVPKIEF